MRRCLRAEMPDGCAPGPMTSVGLGPTAPCRRRVCRGSCRKHSPIARGSWEAAVHSPSCGTKQWARRLPATNGGWWRGAACCLLPFRHCQPSRCSSPQTGGASGVWPRFPPKHRASETRGCGNALRCRSPSRPSEAVRCSRHDTMKCALLAISPWRLTLGCPCRCAPRLPPAWSRPGHRTCGWAAIPW